MQSYAILSEPKDRVKREFLFRHILLPLENEEKSFKYTKDLAYYQHRKTSFMKKCI